MVDQMRRQTEDVIRYYGEVDRRVTTTGMDGIAGLLIVSQQVEAALGAVGSQELEWLMREVRTLLERLVRLDSQLQQLRALKTFLAAETGTPRLPG
jgi:3-methyladenine DNA glycosylase/8-oxoguanine DNA glycosylase